MNDEVGCCFVPLMVHCKQHTSIGVMFNSKLAINYIFVKVCVRTWRIGEK